MRPRSLSQTQRIADSGHNSRVYRWVDVENGAAPETPEERILADAADKNAAGEMTDEELATIRETVTNL
jgi:hypothetical protein